MKIYLLIYAVMYVSLTIVILSLCALVSSCSSIKLNNLTTWPSWQFVHTKATILHTYFF